VSRKQTPEVYVSIDIETDGPIPGVNSMLSLGAVAIQDGLEIGGWYGNFEPLPGAVRDEDTTAFWAEHMDAYTEATRNPVEAHIQMIQFSTWLRSVRTAGHALVAVGWPIAFDFAFVNWYFHRFTGRNPLGFGGLDIRSYANGLAGYPSYYGLPEAKVWAMAGPIDKEGLRPHNALDDAIGQGRLFVALQLYAKTYGMEGE
jgi:hypothetical protein